MLTHLPTSTGAVIPKPSLARFATALIRVLLGAVGCCDGLGKRALQATGEGE